MKPLASVHNRRKASLTGLKEQAIFRRAQSQPMRQVGFATPVYNYMSLNAVANGRLTTELVVTKADDANVQTVPDILKESTGTDMQSANAH